MILQFVPCYLHICVEDLYQRLHISELYVSNNWTNLLTLPLDGYYGWCRLNVALKRF